MSALSWLSSGACCTMHTSYNSLPLLLWSINASYLTLLCTHSKRGDMYVPADPCRPDGCDAQQCQWSLFTHSNNAPCWPHPNRHWSGVDKQHCLEVNGKYDACQVTGESLDIRRTHRSNTRFHQQPAPLPFHYLPTAFPTHTQTALPILLNKRPQERNLSPSIWWCRGRRHGMHMEYIVQSPRQIELVLIWIQIEWLQYR